MIILTDSNGPRDLGYLQVDHRACGGQNLEMHTYTCRHCEAVVVLNPDRKRARYKCTGCNHHICDGCAAKVHAGEPCRSYQQMVDEYLERVSREA